MKPRLFLLVALALVPSLHAEAREISEAGKACIECHSSSTPGIVEQWKTSAHAKSGVDCYSCHKAKDGNPATFDHNGYKIAVIVTPSYCARCHEAEVKQFEKSHHAAAAKFIGSLDNTLGEIVEGAQPPTTAAGNATGTR
jgi:hydroxylamine dehydrogenase